MLTTSPSGVTTFGPGPELQRGRGRGRGGLGYKSQGRGSSHLDQARNSDKTQYTPARLGSFTSQGPWQSTTAPLSRDRQPQWGLPAQTTSSGPLYSRSSAINSAHSLNSANFTQSTDFKPVPFVKAVSTEEETSKISEALTLLTQSLANVQASQNARIQSPFSFDAGVGNPETRPLSNPRGDLNTSMSDVDTVDDELKVRPVNVFYIDEWYNANEVRAIRALTGASRIEFPLMIDYENDHRLPYRASRSSTVLRTRLHKGQRKLYLGVKNFLTRTMARLDAKTTIVYAGAAPCTNLPLLLEEFPNTIWILYDPAPFRIALSEQNEDRVTLHNELFTDDIAKSWRGRCDLFISDIRAGGVDQDDEETSSLSSTSGFEQQVKLDMDAQARWVKLIGARMAMLKMRLPYASGTTTYLSGQLHIQAFAPKASTESRLFTDGTSTFDYSNDKYNDWFYYHNAIRREWAYFAHKEEAPGLCHCYDCMLEIDIHHQYRRKQAVLDDANLEDVLSRDFDKVTQFLKIDMLEGGHAYKPDVPMWLKRKELVAMNPTSRDPRWSERHSIVPSVIEHKKEKEPRGLKRGPIGTERAQRMMQSQGWVPGSGLGPELSGRSEPISVTNRYGSRAGLGLGSYSDSFAFEFSDRKQQRLQQQQTTESLPSPSSLSVPLRETDVTEITLPAYTTRQWSLSIQVNESDLLNLAKQLATSLETLRKITAPRVISEWSSEVTTDDDLNLEPKAEAYDIDQDYEDPSIAHEREADTDAQHDPNQVLIDMNLYKKLCLIKNEFAKYDPRRFNYARNLANPWEYTREDGGTFVNRCGMKLANIDFMVNRKITTANLDDDKMADGTNRGNLYVGDMCAAPGGFAAFLLAEKKWRARIMAISLRTPSRDYRIPTFAINSDDVDSSQLNKRQSSFKPISPTETFTTYFGPRRESDGNVLDSTILNGWIQHLIDNTPDKQGVDVLQADGGLSVEGKENEQEYYTSKLILAECIAAIQATRVRGNALIKWFDMVTPFSATMLWIMAHVFTKVQVLKPEESRPANSECYIWFENKRPRSIHLANIIDALLSYYRNKDVCFDGKTNLPRIQLLSLSVLSYTFTNKLKEINTVLGQHQWFFCKEILSLLSRPGPLPNVHDVDYHLFISKPMGQTLGQFGEFYQTDAIEISDILRQRWSDGRPNQSGQVRSTISTATTNVQDLSESKDLVPIIVPVTPSRSTSSQTRRGGPRINMLFDDDELRFARHESCQEYHQEGTFIWNWPLETQNIANAVQGISDVIKDLFCHPAWFNIRFSKTETKNLGEEFILLDKRGGGVIQQARLLINETKATKSTSFIYPLSTSVYTRESSIGMDTSEDDNDEPSIPSFTTVTSVLATQTRLLLGLPAILVCICRYQVLYVYDVQDDKWSWLEIRTKFDTDGNALDTPQRHINDKLVKVDPEIVSQLSSDMWRIPPETVLSGIYMTNIVSDSRFYVLDVSKLPDTILSLPDKASDKLDDVDKQEAKQQQHRYISCKDRQAILVDFMATTTEPMLQYRRPLDPNDIHATRFSMPTDLILVTDVGWHMIRMTFV